MNTKSKNQATDPNPEKVLTLNQLVDNPSENEQIKDKSHYLRGTILEEIGVEVTSNINPDDAQLTKFHGTYIQDDRDQRLDRQKKKLEPAYAFMIRVRIPGGVLSAEQWVQMDKIADEWAGERIKLSTRQAVQFHGIIKFELAKAMQALHQVGMDSIAACGDVNRNVMCTPVPYKNRVHEACLHWATQISEHLLPKTTAWYDIWIDGKKITSEEAEKQDEPVYGKHYLPRKFKIAIAIPPQNDTDLFSNDIGLAAIEKAGALVGFNVYAGGGLGTTHSDRKTYPKLAEPLGFCKPQDVLAVCESIMTVQRDYGNRSERKNARLKYTIDRVGLSWFKDAVEQRSGVKLAKIHPVKFDHNGDHYGWTKDEQGLWYLVLHVEHGRVYDQENAQLKAALRKIADKKYADFRLTGNQNIAFGRVKTKDKAHIEQILNDANYQSDASHMSGMRRHAIACVALPTCALAMAEAQRYLPSLIGQIEPILQKHGLLQDDINIRMTGCPNGCGRPWLGEVAFIGKSPGKYNFYLGAAFDGSRLASLYKENADEALILSEMDVLLGHYAKDRTKGERFGDFVIRQGYVKVNQFHPD